MLNLMLPFNAAKVCLYEDYSLLDTDAWTRSTVCEYVSSICGDYILQ